MEGEQKTEELEKTRPPVSALRFPTPDELFAATPQLRELLQLRPREGGTNTDFLHRLFECQTPEEAITFTAFAVQPKLSVWWGYECLRTLSTEFSREDRDLLERIATWSTQGGTEIRYQIMQKALFAETRSAAVMLGLAAGWSGTQAAPNDLAPVHPNRTPRAVNAAVLSALAQCGLANRAAHMANLLKLAESMFQAY